MMPPSERLAASRERLRHALAPGGMGSAAGADGGEPLIATLARAWAMPRVALAADLARGVVAPLVQRHPLTLVLGAAVAGAVLVRLRPWRGVLRPALLAGVLPLLLKGALRLPPGLWTQLLAQLSKKA